MRNKMTEKKNQLIDGKRELCGENCFSHSVGGKRNIVYSYCVYKDAENNLIMSLITENHYEY